MGFRLRRVNFDQHIRFAAGEKNPFERLTRPPNHGGLMRLCLHTTGLIDLSDEQAAIVRELCQPYRSKAIQVSRTPAEVQPPYWQAPVAFELERWSDASGSVWLKKENGGVVSGIPKPRDWSYEFQRKFGAREHRRDIVGLLAAGALPDAVDLIVTAREDLLAMRATSPLRTLPLLSPHEVFPLVGIWSRAIGQSYLAGFVNISDWYPLVLAVALLRESWGDIAVLIQGRDALPNGSGRECEELAQSILTRFQRAISALDRLALTWLRRNSQSGEMELDEIVLALSAIQDNVALLVTKFLDITNLPTRAISLASKRWRQALAKTKNPRAANVRHYVLGASPLFKVADELRHHAVHRAVLSTARSQRAGHRQNWIQLPPTVAETMRAELQRLGDSPSEWGITGTGLLGDPAAYLEAMPFATHSLAGTARLVNGILRRLDPRTDYRYPETVRIAASQEPEAFLAREFFSRADCRVAVLSSPLSGLVDAA